MNQIELKPLFFFLLIGWTLPMLGQSQQITGLLTFQGRPMTGVTILNYDLAIQTKTDTEGTFSISAFPRDQIRIVQADAYYRFFVGSASYYPIAVDSLELQESDELDLALNDVIITALGVKRESKDLGYAIQKVEGKELSEVQSPNFVNNLAGRIAGVTVTQGPTGVGSTAKISIRGESSFTNNNPLFVIDGIIINNRSTVNFTNDAAAGFQEVDFGNGAMAINPDDVASVSVLKGPSAAALYGTRASNGVILITTKDGSTSKGSGISFNSSFFLENPFQLPQFQNQYGQGNSGQFEFVDGLGGGINDNITYSYGPQLDVGIDIPQFDSPVTLANGQVVRGADVAIHGGAPITPTPFVSQPNNLRDFYQTGFTAINNLSVAKSFDQGNYRLSLSDLRSESVIPGVNLNRQNLAARVSFQPSKRLEISAALNYVRSESDNRPANGYGSENINYSLVAWMGRQTNIESLRDYWQPGLEEIQQYSFNYTFFDNPFFILHENRNSFGRDRAFGNLNLRYQLSEKLSLQVRSGMDYSDERRQFRRNYSSNRFRQGAYAEHDVTFREINSDFLLNYQDQKGDFSFDLSVGGNRMDQYFETRQSQALALAQPGIFNLGNAATPIEVFQFASQRRINSLYGLAKLGYRDWAFLDITGRNDWSSALATPFSTENTSFFYPSASLSLIFSQLLSLPHSISFAKARISYAQVGNDTDPYQTVGVFLAQTPYNNLPTFSRQDQIVNPNLLPEQTRSFETGIDLRFLDDRIALDATYFQATTENQILSLPVPVSSGFTEQVRNGGSVQTEGWEIILGLKPIYRKDFKWTAQFNFSRYVSTVTSLPEEAERITLAYTRVYDNINQTVWYQVREGDRIGDMWGTGYLRNDEGEFVVTEEGRFIVDNTLKKLGNYNPDFILGMSNQLSWGSFQFSFLLDWRQGGILVSRTLSLAGVAGQLIETVDRPEEGIAIPGVVNRGSTEQPNYQVNQTRIPAETYYRSFYDRNHEENNVYDASYAKLREVSLSYRFEFRRFPKGSIQVALIGRNLFAISAIPHFDPEQFAVQGQNFINGVEDMSYPTVRSYGIKVGLNF